ncbi:hypothetical protein JL720_16674 [Aureococcus anophagefferens]|nr:hypothetical protein JL720_16674 [Aureococcus anophagefferens]
MGLLPRCALLAVAAAAADVADIADFRNYAAGKLKAGLAQKKLAAAFDGSEAARMRRPKRMLDTIHPYIREAWDTKGRVDPEDWQRALDKAELTPKKDVAAERRQGAWAVGARVSQAAPDDDDYAGQCADFSTARAASPGLDRRRLHDANADVRPQQPGGVQHVRLQRGRVGTRPLDCMDCAESGAILVVGFSDCTGMCVDEMTMEIATTMIGFGGIDDSACVPYAACYDGDSPVLSAATGGTNTFFLDGGYAHEADDHEGREHGEDDDHHAEDDGAHGGEHGAVECMASNCPTFDDFDYYSYSYDSDDNYFDGTCASVSDIVEFAYQCTMGGDSCSACADLIRTYVEDMYEYILTGIGLDCDLSCPAVGVTNVVTGDLTDEYVTVTISAASRRRRLTDTLTVAYTIETPTLEMAEEAAAGSARWRLRDRRRLQAEAADQGVSSEFASVQTTAASTPTASTEGEALDGASAASAFGVVLSAAVGLARAPEADGRPTPARAGAPPRVPEIPAR